MCFNNRRLFQTDKTYATVDLRQPRPMYVLVGGRYTEPKVEGEFKLNWNKLEPMANIHLTGEYSDMSTDQGLDYGFKVRKRFMN